HGPNYVPDTGAHAISVLRNNGSGTFGQDLRQSPGLSPRQAVSGDFNLDGKLDMAVTGASPVSVAIHRGVGDGTFLAPISFALPESGLSIGTADLNRNGILDLVVGTPTQIRVFLGGAAASFVAGPTVAGAQTFDGELPDLNRDGVPDLVTFSGSTVFTRLGLGTGAFNPPASTTVTGTVRGVGFGDLDRNGRTDLVVLTSSNISVRPGVGNGTFLAGTSYLTGHSFNGKPVIADLNLDGKLDVAAADNGDTGTATVGMTVLLGTGTGTLTGELTFPTLDMPLTAAVADMNRDGKPDLLAMNSANNWRPGTVSLLEGNGSGTFSARTDYGAGALGGRLLIGDYNRDGRPDVGLTTVDGTEQARLKVLRGNAAGTFGTFATRVDYAGATGEQAVAVADMNRDGRLDAIVIGTNAGNGVVGICLGNGLGGLGAPTFSTTFPDPVAVAVADFNVDGIPDVAVACGSFQMISVFVGSGTGTLAARSDVFLGETPTAIAAGDWDRDGSPDLVAVSEATGDLMVLFGGGGMLTLSDIVPPSGGLGPVSIAVADFNGDGVLDVVTANHASDNITYYLGSGFSFAPVSDFIAGTAPTSVAVGDFNRDGFLDLAVGHEPSGADQVAIMLGQPGGSFQFPTDFPLPDGPRSVTVADVDRDGDDDLVIAARSANLVSVLMGSGTGSGSGLFAPRVDYATGTLPGGVAVGDLNVDGRPDILVSNFTTANTSVLLNGGSVVTGVEATAPAAPPTARLAQNTPNPFNPRTTIGFHLDTAGPTRLMVFDVSGRRVATLVEKSLPSGDHRADWDGHDAAGRPVASGVYFYRLEAPGFSDSRAMVMLK
ncbi:MAG: FG-GAP-like repeat-containing protein, partial [Candidatus Eiseniibacteriota bacterium]